MAQALAPYSCTGHLDTAFVTHNPPIADLFVFAAIALVVSLRSKDGFTEQAIFFGPQTSVVDCLRLGHLTIGPRKDLLR